MLKLLTNYCPRKLKEKLRTYGVFVDINPKRSLKEFLAYGDTKYDLYYFARVVPPAIERHLTPKRGPLIYAFHSPLKIDYPCRPSHLLHNFLIPIQAKVMSRSSILHVLNKADFDIARAIRARSFYLPLGTDIELFRPQKKDETFTVIYASRASWNKGTDILCNIIIPYLLKRIKRINIKIVSYGFLKHLYKQFANAKNIEILPYMSEKDYAETLSKTHLLLFPSRYESYGLVVLEALASGVIPVAFNVSGFVRDVLAKSYLSSFVVDGLNASAFLAKVMMVYKMWEKNEDKYYELVREARELAEKYSWQSLARSWALKFKLVAEAK